MFVFSRIIIKGGTSTLLLATNKVKNLTKYGMVLKFNSECTFSTVQITKNLELHSNTTKPLKVNNFKLVEPQGKPLVILLSWMLAKKRHLSNFVQYYTKFDFDVLKVTITPWQLLWPVSGSQVVANDVLTFLDVNSNYPLFIHGFSVGGYQWGEVLAHIARDPKRYQHIINRLVGQVWDSAADITEIPVGFPMAVFPNNLVLQNAMRQYLHYHMKTFEKVATCHYIRSSQIFHSDLVKAPALFLVSKTDPIGAVSSNQLLREDWERNGAKVYWKCWDKSPHVSHYHYHRKEYVEQLEEFLSKVGLLAYREKLQAKL